jgi:hypothetical protein
MTDEIRIIRGQLLIQKEKKMNTEPTNPTHGPQRQMMIRSGGGDTVYGLGMIGAWVYYFKHATTNEERMKAFFKGLFWPAFMVYDVLNLLKKE